MTKSLVSSRSQKRSKEQQGENLQSFGVAAEEGAPYLANLATASTIMSGAGWRWSTTGRRGGWDSWPEAALLTSCVQDMAPAAALAAP